MKTITQIAVSEQVIYALTEAGDIYCGCFSDVWSENSLCHERKFRWDYRLPGIPEQGIPTMRRQESEPLTYQSRNAI